MLTPIFEKTLSQTLSQQAYLGQPWDSDPGQCPSLGQIDPKCSNSMQCNEKSRDSLGTNAKRANHCPTPPVSLGTGVELDEMKTETPKGPNT